MAASLGQISPEYRGVAMSQTGAYDGSGFDHEAQRNRDYFTSTDLQYPLQSNDTGFEGLDFNMFNNSPEGDDQKGDAGQDEEVQITQKDVDELNSKNKNIDVNWNLINPSYMQLPKMAKNVYDSFVSGKNIGGLASARTAYDAAMKNAATAAEYLKGFKEGQDGYTVAKSAYDTAMASQKAAEAAQAASKMHVALSAIGAGVTVGSDIYDKYKTNKAYESQADALRNTKNRFENIKDNTALAQSYTPFNQSFDKESNASRLGKAAKKTGDYTMSGASLGASLGGGVGALIGGGIGAIAGGISSAADWAKQNKAYDKMNSIIDANRINYTNDFYQRANDNNNIQQRKELYTYHKDGGSINNTYEPGTELEVDEEAYNELLKQGYKLQII